MTRYVVVGAGAVGGAVGALLAEAGRQVLLVARGAHADALAGAGLRLRRPGRPEVICRLAVARGVGEVDWAPGDVALLATKTQDTLPLLEEMAAAAGADLPVACLQNGVENERMALRRFSHVYAVCVIMPVVHLEPGVVEMAGTGVLDVGRYPAGTDGTAARLAADLTAAGLVSQADPEVLAHKHRKLLVNLGNALEAAAGPAARDSALHDAAREEALACFAAAGLACASAEQEAARRAFLRVETPTPGGSSWQSLARGTRWTEVDYLNGEVVLLGRLTGVATPVNAGLQRLAWRLARERVPPGSLRLADIEAELAGAPAGEAL